LSSISPFKGRVKPSGNPTPRLALVPATTDDDAPPVGQPLTLATAFRQFSPYVARIGIRILGRDDGEIDDLVQDVFTHAAAGLQRFAHPAEVKQWLATVTVRASVRRLRARRLRRFVFLSDDRAGVAEPVSPAASPEQRALIARIYRLLDGLPARQRAAWVLRHIEGDRLEEVASHLGCSLATAKRLIAAAENWIDGKLGDATPR
jgi:RNA polymerase sigma-70 factor (ECF subfamily)